MKNTLIQIVLAIVSLALAYWLFEIIMDPIRFDKSYEKRRKAVIERMMDIRTAQGAYKDGNGMYAQNFEDLISFTDTGVLLIIQRRDSSFNRMNPVYQIEEVVDTLIIDTLGSVSIKDSLFPDYDLSKLAIIPYSKGDTFNIDAAILTKPGGLKVPVFQVIADKEVYCKGLDKTLVKARAKDLIMGSMTEATVNGNWQ